MKSSPLRDDREGWPARHHLRLFSNHFNRYPNLSRIVGNTGWLLSEKFLRLFVGLLVGLWVARYLGPEQFGVLNYAIALAMMFGAVAGLGLDSIIVRDIVSEPGAQGEILGSAFVLKVLAGLVATALAIATASILRSDDVLARAAVGIIAAGLAFKALDVIQFWFESQVKAKYAVWARNASFISISLVKLILILTRQPLLAFVWATMLEIVIGAFALLAAYRIAGERITMWRVRFDRAKDLLRSGWPLLLSTAAMMVYMRIDTIMLGSMVGDHAVGVYSAAVRVSELWYFVPVAVVTSVFPGLLQLREIDKERYKGRFELLYDIMVWFGLSIAVVTMVAAGWIVQVLYGELYLKAAGVLVIHIWAGAFVFLGVASEKWFLAERLSHLLFIRTVIGAALNVALNLVLIPRFGIVGAAWATLVAQGSACYGFDVLLSQTRPMFWSKTRSLLLITSMRRVKAVIVEVNSDMKHPRP